MQHHVAGSNKYNTWLSSPSSITIIKNKHDHKGAAGIWATASGYAMNASPGPKT